MLMVGGLLLIGLIGTYILRFKFHFRFAMGVITETAFACSLLNIGVFLLFILLGNATLGRGPISRIYFPLYTFFQGGLIPLIGIGFSIWGMIKERGLLNWWLLQFNGLFLVFDILLVWLGGLSK